jgi:hypothetical protein
MDRTHSTVIISIPITDSGKTLQNILISQRTGSNICMAGLRKRTRILMAVK